MNRCARSEELEDLVLGLLPAQRASQVMAHAGQCPRCAAELSCVRRQRELFVVRARSTAGPRPDLQDVLARIESRRTQARSSVRQGSAVIAATLAAAAGVVLAWSTSHHLPSALQTAVAPVADLAGQQSHARTDAPSTCEPVTCSDSVLACEPVTCAPAALFAQSEIGSCDERPRAAMERCVSEESFGTAIP